MEIHFCILKLEDDFNSEGGLARYWDELLDIYSLYLKTGILSIKEDAIRKAYLIHMQNPASSFVL